MPRILDSGILDTYCQEGSAWEQSSWIFGFGLDKKGEAVRLEFRSSGKESVRAGMVAMSKQTGGADSGALLRHVQHCGSLRAQIIEPKGLQCYCNFMDRKMGPEGKGHSVHQ